MRQMRHQFQVSHMTVFCAWKKHGYHASYNHNAAYYTLADLPQFDDWGLWARGKSAALSGDDWPDILIGDLPHLYPYIVNNVGGALVAKRRSYGVIVSHLTPPFTDAGLYGELERLHELVHEFDYSEDELLKHELRRSISDAVRQMDMTADLGLDAEALDNRLLDDEEIVHLRDCLHPRKERRATA
jgi:cobaltochelatase CobN